MRRDRIRIVGAEACRRCHAAIYAPCRRRWYGHVLTCMVEVGCKRCGAQQGDCRCPMPVIPPPTLFPPGHECWDEQPTVKTGVLHCRPRS